MRTLLFGLCVAFGLVCDTASADCKNCPADAVVVVGPWAPRVVVRQSDTVVVVNHRPFLFPWRAPQVIVVRGK